MAKTLISSSPSFIGTPLPSSASSRHGGLHSVLLPNRRFISTRVKLSFHEIPPVTQFDSYSSIDFAAILTRAESLLYTLADAAVATADSAASTAASSTSTDAAVQKSGGWFGFISKAMEFVIKVKIYFTYLAFFFLLKF